MTMDLEQLSKEELVDLLKAYDAYITAAADAGRLTTGWVPVCIAEFYACEYQEIWCQGETFDYMYDYEAPEQTAALMELLSGHDAHIFFENDQMMCQFNDESEIRFVRSRIQDIKAGDAFFTVTGLHCAAEAAHQNLDEPDALWVVFDLNGDGWFEEDIAAVSLAPAAPEKHSLSEKIQQAESKAMGKSVGGQYQPGQNSLNQGGNHHDL